MLPLSGAATDQQASRLDDLRFSDRHLDVGWSRPHDPGWLQQLLQHQERTLSDLQAASTTTAAAGEGGAVSEVLLISPELDERLDTPVSPTVALPYPYHPLSIALALLSSSPAVMSI